MPFKYNPLTGNLDLVNSTTATSTAIIPQYNSDPVSPSAEDAWVRSTSNIVTPVLSHSIAHIGLTAPGGAVTYTYDFSYRTQEGVTVRVPLT